MQLEFALFCEAAVVTDSGIIHILHGGYDLISTTAFPAMLPRMALVVRVLCDPSEFNQTHVIFSQMIDPHGRILPAQASVSFTPRPFPRHPERKNRQTFLLDHLNVSFPEPGDYVFRFLVDGNPIGQAGLEAVRI